MVVETGVADFNIHFPRFALGAAEVCDGPPRRGALLHSSPHCLLIAYQCIRAYSPHHLPWSGHSFPSQLNCQSWEPQLKSRKDAFAE